jgi:hypothetical protein
VVTGFTFDDPIAVVWSFGTRATIVTEYGHIGFFAAIE